MEVFNALEPSAVKIETFSLQRQALQGQRRVDSVLSQAGPKDSPEYGLRFFHHRPGRRDPDSQSLLLSDHVHPERKATVFFS